MESPKRPDGPTLLQLRAFISVFETGSITHTCGLLSYLNPSSVSYPIRQLEALYGLPLFQRSGRGMAPTDAGKVLYQAAREMLNELERAEATLHALRGTFSGPLHVATPQATYFLLLSAYHALRERFPAIDTAILSYPASSQALNSLVRRESHVSQSATGGNFMERRGRVSDGEIVHVAAGTPGGEWLRRYWLAVGLSAELQDIPQAVRVLGEDLVLFRDGSGRPGLIGAHCPHRGTSLEYGDIEASGIRCAYHGWLFDVHGRCLEQPAEPKGSTFHQRVRHLAYPVQELGGVLFAYLGPESDAPPPLPRYAPLLDRPETRQFEPVRHWHFNWFNFWENALDGAHLWILHRDSAFGNQTWDNQFFNPADPPLVDFEETEFGVRMLMHKPSHEPGTEFVDAFAVALPTVIEFSDTEFSHVGVDQSVSLEGRNKHLMFLTPNDDDRFMIFTVDYYTGDIPDFFARLRAARAAGPAPEAAPANDPRPLAPYRGFVRREDYVAQSTQGKLGQRKEHLGVEDRGIIMLRRMVRQAVEAVRAGARPRGVLSVEQAGRVVDIGSFAGLRPALSPGGRGLRP